LQRFPYFEHLFFFMPSHTVGNIGRLMSHPKHPPGMGGIFLERLI
jgi:hypothetical protein